MQITHTQVIMNSIYNERDARRELYISAVRKYDCDENKFREMVDETMHKLRRHSKLKPRKRHLEAQGVKRYLERYKERGTFAPNYKPKQAQVVTTDRIEIGVEC